MRPIALFMLPLLFGACRGAVGPDQLEITVVPIALRYPHDGPLTIAVTAVNRGTTDVVWGQGSSGCQLDLYVRVAGTDRRIDNRACTADFVFQRLAPGASRVEEFLFEGEYRDGTGLHLLQPGRYEVRAGAGERWRSAPITIEVVVTGAP